jgi:rRNA maturation RNase YbeY
MIEVEINQRVKCKLERDFFCDIIRDTLQKMKVSKAKVSLAIVDDEEIKALNFKYRKKNEATDVLSFCEQEITDDFLVEENYLGEIVLDYPYIVRQAQEMKNSLEKEMALMLRHGLMHLLGYTHEQMKELAIEAI